MGEKSRSLSPTLTAQSEPNWVFFGFEFLTLNLLRRSFEETKRNRTTYYSTQEIKSWKQNIFKDKWSGTEDKTKKELASTTKLLAIFVYDTTQNNILWF